MKFSSGQQRYQGYEDVCRKYGRKAVWIDCDYDYDAGLAAAEELIRRYPDTDGILASNDMAAMAVYKVLHQNGRRVPEDVQLVGFMKDSYGLEKDGKTLDIRLSREDLANTHVI